MIKKDLTNYEDCAICFIESPLQLLCLRELMEIFKVPKWIVYVKFTPGRAGNKSQLIRLVEEDDLFSGIKGLEFHYKTISGAAKHLITEYFDFHNTRAYQNQGLKYVVVGDLRIPWMRRYAQAFSFHKAIVLDDGMASFAVRDEILIKNNFRYRERFEEFNLKSIYKVLISKIYYIFLKTELNLSNILLFSAFISKKSSPVNLIENNFSYLKTINDKKKRCSEVWYFGSPLSERHVIDLSVEVELLKYVSKYYKDRSFKLLYYSHRDDSEEKLKLIQGLGIDLKRSTVPAELMLVKSDRQPCEFSASGSSIFFTLSKVTNDTRFTNFVLPDSCINPNFRELRSKVNFEIKERLCAIEEVVKL